MMWSELTLRLIQAAFDEDLGQRGDLSSALLPDPTGLVEARIVPRRVGVIAGLTLAPVICRQFNDRYDGDARFDESAVHDGGVVQLGDVVGLLRGSRVAILAMERTLLNFLCRMSGVATLTAEYCAAVAKCGAAHIAPPRVFDTRKTIPGWRELDKYAVRCGGGHNHRSGLHDAVLLKDNHLAGIPTERLAESVRAMVVRARTPGDATALPAFVEVEVDTLEQFDEVCGVDGVDIILLDNFRTDQMRDAVARRSERGLRGKVELEASGGVTLETVRAIAATGVDRIAIGALTHSAPALDIGLDFD